MIPIHTNWPTAIICEAVTFRVTYTAHCFEVNTPSLCLSLSVHCVKVTIRSNTCDLSLLHVNSDTDMFNSSVTIDPAHPFDSNTVC